MCYVSKNWITGVKNQKEEAHISLSLRWVAGGIIVQEEIPSNMRKGMPSKLSERDWKLCVECNHGVRHGLLGLLRAACKSMKCVEMNVYCLLETVLVAGGYSVD